MEVKASSALEKPARMQLLYYLWYLDRVYDVSRTGVLAYPAERTHIYRKLLRRRLEHIQQSVFYGDVTEGQLTGIHHDIEDAVKPDDSIYVFTAEVAGTVDCTVIGDAEEPGSKFT